MINGEFKAQKKSVIIWCNYCIAIKNKYLVIDAIHKKMRFWLVIDIFGHDFSF